MRISILASLTLSALVASIGVTRAFDVGTTPTASTATSQKRIAVGDTAPAFSLSDETGATVAFPAPHPRTTVLVFYRGSWCPFCARQLSELRGLVKDGEGVDLYAISIDPTAKSAVLSDRIGHDGKGALGYRLLSDPDHRTIDAYGLHDERYDGSEYAGIPRPAVVVVDSTNRVSWVRISEDYKIRPSVAEIRSAIDAATGPSPGAMSWNREH